MDHGRRTDEAEPADEEIEAAALEGDEDAGEPAAAPGAPDHYTEDSLGTYLREIGRYPLISGEREVELAQRIEAGAAATRELAARRAGRRRRELERARRDGIEAQHQMARANLRLVVSIARRYRAAGVPLLDLVQEGNIGLMRAVEKFDWRRGFKFSTYATWWIRQAIQRGIADRGRTIRLPVHVHEMLMRIRRARAKLEAETGREPTEGELARAARLPAAKVREIRALAGSALSLEMPVGEAGGATVGEFVPDPAADGRFAEVLTGIGREELDRTLSTLTEREQEILCLRFALRGGDPLTLEEVGRRFGLTRERIRQLESKALAKLRHPSRSAALLTHA